MIVKTLKKCKNIKGKEDRKRKMGGLNQYNKEANFVTTKPLLKEKHSLENPFKPPNNQCNIWCTKNVFSDVC